jgi:hypothetical protein
MIDERGCFFLNGKYSSHVCSACRLLEFGRNGGWGSSPPSSSTRSTALRHVKSSATDSPWPAHAHTCRRARSANAPRAQQHPREQLQQRSRHQTRLPTRRCACQGLTFCVWVACVCPRMWCGVRCLLRVCCASRLAAACSGSAAIRSCVR